MKQLQEGRRRSSSLPAITWVFAYKCRWIFLEKNTNRYRCKTKQKRQARFIEHNCINTAAVVQAAVVIQNAPCVAAWRRFEEELRTHFVLRRGVNIVMRTKESPAKASVRASMERKVCTSCGPSSDSITLASPCFQSSLPPLPPECSPTIFANAHTQHLLRALSEHYLGINYFL